MLTQQRALVRMPELTGLSVAKARLIVENAGLRVEQILFQESYEPRDQVLLQRPARGQMVYAGEKVTLTISRDSYVKWLPSIYQRADINGQNFTRDFLWILQHLFGSVEAILEVIHAYFDPLEAPEEFLPWLASWSAMVYDEDWPVAKKRLLIRKAIELYRIRGTLKGLKLFIALFTGHEPTITENVWPFPGWRIGTCSQIAVDSIVLPPVNLAHTFIVEMPVSYKDVSPEAIIRIHEIIQLEKPANTQYYLRFGVEEYAEDLSEFLAIRREVEQAIGERASNVDAFADAAAAASSSELQVGLGAAPANVDEAPVYDEFNPPPRQRPPLPKAPRADSAPIEGREAPRSSQEGGFDGSAREMPRITDSQWIRAIRETDVEAAPVEPIPMERTEPIGGGPTPSDGAAPAPEGEREPSPDKAPPEKRPAPRRAPPPPPQRKPTKAGAQGEEEAEAPRPDESDRSEDRNDPEKS